MNCWKPKAMTATVISSQATQATGVEGSETRDRAKAVTSPRVPCGLRVEDIVRYSGENRRLRLNSAGNICHGQAHTGTAQPIEEALIDSASKSAREGGAPDLIFLNHAQMRKLIKQLGSKVEYSKAVSSGAKDEKASAGFRSVCIQGDNGVIDVVAANKCQSDIAWVLEKKSCLLATLGPAVKFLQLDGNKILRQSSADGYEVRLGMRGQFGSKAPNHNVHCSLAAAT